MRIVARVFIFIIALGFVLAPALYLARDSLGPMVVSWAAKAGLGIDDLGGLRFKVTDIGRRGVTIEALSMAGGRVSAERARVTYELGEMLSGRVRDIAIEGLTLRVRYTEGEIDLGPFQTLVEARGAAATTPLGAGDFPLERLDLDNARLVLSVDGGALELTGDLVAEVTPDGPLSWSGELRGRLSSEALGGGQADARAALSGHLDRAGEIHASLDLRHADARFRDLTFATMRGGMSARLPANARPVLRAALEIGKAKARETVIPRITLDAYAQGESGSLSAVIGDPASPSKSFTLAGEVGRRANGRARLAVSGEGALGLLHELTGAVLGWPLTAVTGELSFAADVGLSGTLDDILGDPRAALARAVGNGHAELVVSSVLHADKAHALDARVGVTLALAPGILEAQARTGSRLRLPKASARVLGRLAPEAIRPWFDEGLTLLAEVEGAPLAALMSLAGDAPTVQITGGLRAEFGADRALALGGDVVLRSSGNDGDGPWSAAMEGVFLRARGMGLDGFRLQEGEAVFTGAVGPKGLSAGYSLKARVNPTRPMPVGETALHLGGAITSAGSETKLSVARVDATIGSSPGGDGALWLSQPVRISAPPDSATQVIFSHAHGVAAPRLVKTALDVGRVRLGRPGAEVAEVIELDIGRVTGTFETTKRKSGGRATLGVDQIRVGGAGPPVRLSELALSAGFRGADPVTGLDTVDLSVAEIALLGAPVWMTPVKVALSGRRHGEDAMLDLRGSVAGTATQLEIPISGILRLDDNSGRLAVEKTWLAFGPDALSLGALSPALGSRIEELRGRIGLAGHLAWPDTDGSSAPHASVELEGVSLTAAGVVVENAVGKIAFSTFAPLRSEGPATLSMDMLGVGVPILRPRLAFSIDGLDGIVAHRVSGEFAGGRISATDIDVPLDGPISAEIQATGVDAAVLSTLLKVEGLDAEGSLSGVLPVTWMPGLGLSIKDGRLAADGPGTVRYKAGEKDEALRRSGEQVGLMLDALSDFRFKTLELGLAGAPGTGFRVGLALEGANPNLYDGYPVRFNLDLAGQLDDIIETGYRTYTLPDRVRDAVLRGEANE